MKKLYSIVTTGILLVSMIGCGSKDNNQAKSGSVSTKSEPVKLTYWYSWTDKIQENNINLTKKFNETVGKEKGIEVTAEYQGSYDSLHQKLQASFIANTAPAVTIMEIASTKTFAENGILESLDKYIEKDKIDMSDFYQGLLINTKVNDKYYAMPYLRSTPIMYMNTDLLKKAGLDPSGPKTWDELAYYCKEIKEKTGAYGLSMYSYIWTLEAFLLENGTSILNKDETKTNIATTEAKNALKFFQDLKDRGYIRTVAGSDSSKIDADYMNQNTAMWFSSTANLTQVLQAASENKFEVNTSFIPKKVQYGVPTGGGNLIMTSKISDKEKEAAWEFIKWMTSPEQAAYSSEFTGYVSTRKSATATEKIQNLFKRYPQFKVALDQLEAYGYGRPMNPGYAQATKEIVSILDAVWVNDANIDLTVEAAEEKINRMLAN